MSAFDSAVHVWRVIGWVVLLGSAGFLALWIVFSAFVGLGEWANKRPAPQKRETDIEREVRLELEAERLAQAAAERPRIERENRRASLRVGIPIGVAVAICSALVIYARLHIFICGS